jgi:activator of 2-hydroxyglutaryl-CoA dehydratase
LLYVVDNKNILERYKNKNGKIIKTGRQFFFSEGGKYIKKRNKIQKKKKKVARRSKQKSKNSADKNNAHP